MNVISFDFEPALVKRFIEFSWEANRADPFWIPPFRKKLSQQLSPQNPFFTYGSIRHFMVEENSTVLGRISAIINTKARDNEEQLGYLGFFESTKDFGVVEHLLIAAHSFLKEKGIKKVFAPINFSTWHSYRFMTSGFEQQPFLLEPYNPPYYPEFFQKFGYEKAMGYISNIVEDFGKQIQYTEKKSQMLSDAGYSIRQIDMRNMRSELKMLYEISRKSFCTAWGYTETTFSEFLYRYEGIQKLVAPEFIVFAFDSRNEPVGFAFCMPNYANAMKNMNGNSHLLAKIRFLMSKSRADEFIIKSVAVIPEAQGSGVGSVLMATVQKSAHRKGYRKIIHALMRADNVVIKRISEKGGKVFKKYALYQIRL